MKARILPLLGLLALLAACHHADPLFGTWTVDKVNVQFDENRTTPEVVKQVGEMEKHNYFVISSDSILVFSSLETETRGRVSTDQQGNLFLEGAPFGQWKDGQIVTRTKSPLGEIVTTYSKN